MDLRQLRARYEAEGCACTEEGGELECVIHFYGVGRLRELEELAAGQCPGSGLPVTECVTDLCDCFLGLMKHADVVVYLNRAQADLAEFRNSSIGILIDREASKINKDS